MDRPPIRQHVPRAGILDLSWGHPRPSALPISAWADAYGAALRRYGPAALTYGHGAGPGPLVEWLCAHLGATRPKEVFVTAGASQALDLVCAVLTHPGDTVLVDSPTYHLALRIIADHGVSVVPAPVVTAELIRRLQRDGHRVRMLYLVPTFGNPTGASLPEPSRGALVEVARRTGVVVVEDDTYRELAYDGPAPVSLRSLADGDPTVVRIGSFAKTVAPGLRLGFVTAAPALVDRLAARGFVHSGGGVNHATALAMAEFATSGAYDRHVRGLRDLYRGQRDRLAAAVRRHVDGVEFDLPGGGWFLWLRLPDGVSSAALLPRAEAAGVSYVDGGRFFVDGGGDGYARLSFSMLEPDLLEEAAHRLGAAVRSNIAPR